MDGACVVFQTCGDQRLWEMLIVRMREWASGSSRLTAIGPSVRRIEPGLCLRRLRKKAETESSRRFGDGGVASLNVFELKTATHQKAGMLVAGLIQLETNGNFHLHVYNCSIL